MNDGEESDGKRIVRRLDAQQALSDVAWNRPPPIALDSESEDPLAEIPELLDGGSEQQARFSFMAVLVGSTVRVYGGYRGTTGGSLSLYSNGGTSLDEYWSFPFSSGDSIYFRWTYATESGGTITAGSWSSIASGTPTANDDAGITFVICRMYTSATGQKRVANGHCGDAVAPNRLVCLDC